MPLLEKFTLLILAIVFCAQIASRFSPRARTNIQSRFPLFLRSAGAAGALGIGVILARLIVSQYVAWAEHPISRYLLPPYRGPWYFIGYTGSRLVLPWLIAAAAGVLAAYVLLALNARFGGRFFENEEPLLAGLTVFFAGYPALLLGLILVMAAGILLTLLHHILKKGRAPLYFLWAPAAFFAILIMRFFLPEQFEAFFRL